MVFSKIAARANIVPVYVTYQVKVLIFSPCVLSQKLWRVWTVKLLFDVMSGCWLWCRGVALLHSYALLVFVVCEKNCIFVDYARYCPQ